LPHNKQYKISSATKVVWIIIFFSQIQDLKEITCFILFYCGLIKIVFWIKKALVANTSQVLIKNNNKMFYIYIVFVGGLFLLGNL
jgi:hypothetical protein